MKNILVVDNYDSFTYNLVYIVRKLGFSPTIWRNDKFRLDDVNDFDKVILSPGPGLPSEAGLMPELITKFADSKSILGVCLGHQALGEAFGGTLVNLSEVYHGVATTIHLNTEDKIFINIPTAIEVGRYHSWVVDANSFPSVLTVIAKDQNDQIMALRHNIYDLVGLQFHPESIMTEFGTKMISNWLFD